jgi:hypothetical protein
MKDSVDFINFFSNSSGSIDLINLIANIGMATILAALLGYFYVKFGTSQSNRRSFANIFVLLAVTTTLVITVVKTSLALSLGLVGALSIVRFRAAIKEPEELAFLFLVIAIGLGFGADQGLVTTVAFIMALLCFVSYRYFNGLKVESSNFYLTVSGLPDGSRTLENMTNFLQENSSNLIIKRHERTASKIDVVYFIEFSDFKMFHTAQEGLKNLFPEAEWIFVEDVRII